MFSSLQAKLAARRARRQDEARRQAEEAAGQRILEEQSQAIAANKPMDADHVVVPEVIIPRETAEEEVRCSNFWFTVDFHVNCYILWMASIYWKLLESFNLLVIIYVNMTYYPRYGNLC